MLDPFPSIWIFTLGYSFLNPSAQSVIRLLSVSDPMLLRFPEIPLTRGYAFQSGSTMESKAAWLG